MILVRRNATHDDYFSNSASIEEGTIVELTGLHTDFKDTIKYRDHKFKYLILSGSLKCFDYVPQSTAAYTAAAAHSYSI